MPIGSTGRRCVGAGQPANLEPRPTQKRLREGASQSDTGTGWRFNRRSSRWRRPRLVRSSRGARFLGLELPQSRRISATDTCQVFRRQPRLDRWRQLLAKPLQRGHGVRLAEPCGVLGGQFRGLLRALVAPADAAPRRPAGPPRRRSAALPASCRAVPAAAWPGCRTSARGSTGPPGCRCGPSRHGPAGMATSLRFALCDSRRISTSGS